MLQQQGSCDISYSLPGTARFRVNVFVQRGSHAIVMRVIPKTIPGFAELKLPQELARIADLKNGIVLVTGPTGSGKSSTLAAILDRINETKAYHILTIEDPVEFMHRHKRPSFTSVSCTATLRVLRWRCGRRCGRHPRSSWSAKCGTRKPSRSLWKRRKPATSSFLLCTRRMPQRLWNESSEYFRCPNSTPFATVSQKVSATLFRSGCFRAKAGTGRVAAIEILKSTVRTREYLDKGEVEGKSLLDAMRDGDTEGMQHFDGEIEKLIRADLIDYDTAMTYATNPGNLRLQLADLGLELPGPPWRSLLRRSKAKKKEETELEIE